MKFFCLVLSLLLLAGCASPAVQAAAPDTIPATAPPETTEATQPPTTLPPDPVLTLLESMSVEDKVGQLFLIRCDPFTVLSDIETYRPGGLVLFAQDFQGQSVDSMIQTISSYQEAASLPLLISADEEGGSVCRVSAFPAFRSAPFPSPRSLYESGGMDAVLGVEAEKAYLLSTLGINVNLAPVCDIATERGAFMYHRSLGQSPETVGQFAVETTRLMEAFGVGTVLKHFPGYGNNADTHTGTAVDRRSIEELESRDLIPFSMAVMEGCNAIMVSHAIVTAFDETLPASLSPAVHDYLRNIMGFQGVIVPDDLVMEAISGTYGAGEAAVMAVLAGNDLLCSTEYALQYPAVLEAVNTGRIPPELLDTATERVLRWKQQLGLLEF